LTGYRTAELRKTMFDAYVAAAEAGEHLIREGPDAARSFVASFNG